MKMINKWIRRVWFAISPATSPYETVSVQSDLPELIESNKLYIVQEDGENWHASMICPCGCGVVLHMNLLPDDDPCWTIEQHWTGLSSLRPSVWRQKTCRSHFWFIKGRIRWCGS